MIKGLMGGQGVIVNGGNTTLPYIPPNIENPIQGMMRVRGTDIQVFNGSMWTTLGTSYATVELNGPAQAAIAWVQLKMAEEESIKRLAEKHPAVADAVNTINEAYDKLKVIVALTEEENTHA